MGLPPKLTRRLREKQRQLEDSLYPQNPQKRLAGYDWEGKGEIWRLHESLLGVVGLLVKRLGRMEKGRGQEEREACPQGTRL